MPASTRPSSPEPARSRRPRRALRGDREGVTEVVGYLLVFGILSVVLVLSLSAFTVAQEAARGRVVELRAESAAARVAGVVVQVALLAEQQGSGTVVAFSVDLPGQLEGRDYRVHLDEKLPAACTTACTRPDQVRVVVPAYGLEVTTPVFSAGASPSVTLCPTEVGGGAILVRVGAPADGSRPVPAACQPTAADPAPRVFLEAA